MALKIKIDSPNFPEIRDILIQFAEHAKVCETCNVKTGAHCVTGGHILHELTKFEEVQEVPNEDIFEKKNQQ